MVRGLRLIHELRRNRREEREHDERQRAALAGLAESWRQWTDQALVALRGPGGALGLLDAHLTEVAALQRAPPGAARRPVTWPVYGPATPRCRS